MIYDVFLTDTFRKNLKKLKKKHRRIPEDLAPVIRKLEAEPESGDPIPGWDREIWKIRVASSEMRRGKRGAFRVIYFWKENEYSVYLMAIYFKGTKENMTAVEIERLLREIREQELS